MFDCCLKKEKNWFRYRAAAIIVEDDCVLFVTNDNEDYYYSVGGGVHMNESSYDAVIREVYEETGIYYEVDRLAIIHENFFNQSNGSLKGLECHEIAFYYLMKPKGNKNLNSNSYSFNKKEKLFWIPIKDLKKYKTFPYFLDDYFSKKPSEIVHIVTDDRK